MDGTGCGHAINYFIVSAIVILTSIQLLNNYVMKRKIKRKIIQQEW
ncbi:MAG: hypothetical protein KBT36_05470 [Kurthia sp.]|nr:hypothetical protein [Candidatus Kurthia equi]